VGDRTTLNELFYLLRENLAQNATDSETRQAIAASEPVYREFRAGDVRHSQASIDKANQKIHYQPTHVLAAGMAETVTWYINKT
jgi:UDP-N-acetylglucosamine 4-epimerase